MVSKTFLKSDSHRKAIISLYRQLIRGSNRIKSINIPEIAFEGTTKSLCMEQGKYKYDPNNYMKYIGHEINYHIKEEFRVGIKGILTNNKLFNKITKGMQVISHLNGAISGNSKDCNKILQILIDYRREKFYHQEWKADYKENEESYDKYIYKDNPSILLKKKESRIKANQNINEKDSSKRLKRQLNESTENSAYILRRFLKNSQMNQKIPIPQLLPYTNDGTSIPIEETAKLSLTVPGSTKLSAIEEAYDQDIIEGIIKPGIEYDINKYHYLDSLKTIVKEKGPFKVQVNLTEAGPTSIPFIRLPYPRIKKMKDVALDIKYSMRLIRLKTVWNVQPGDTSLSEPRFSDGSYSVRGSRGFRNEERIYPKYFYEDLAIDEGIWEYMILKLEGNKEISLDKTINSYMECLNVSSKVIDAQLNHYFQKYKVLKSSNSPLIKEQQELQRKMNQHYDVQLNKYNELIDILRKNNVVKHSEIINSDIQKKRYGEYISKDDSRRIIKHKKGIPEIERVGMGKKLGDYLDDHNYHNFKLGEKFDKRFKF